MVWCGYAQTGKNPLFSGAFWGYIKSLEEEKGTHITNLENFIYSTVHMLINLDNFVFRDFLSVLLHLGDNGFSLKINEKGQSFQIKIDEKVGRRIKY